jgi:ParB/RepB/Spo0J family partition protein
VKPDVDTNRESASIPGGIGLGSEVVCIDLRDIDVNDKRYQLRVASRAGDLKKSLEGAGQQIPVILLGSCPPYKIVDGFRRIAALGALGRDKVKAIIVEELHERDAVRLSFVQNAKRRNFSPMDRANALWTLSRIGESESDAARDLGLSDRQAARYLRLLQFPKPLQKALDAGDISMAHAAVLSKYEVPDVSAFVGEIKAEKLSAEALAKRLRGMRRKDGRSRTFGRISNEGIRLYPAKVPFHAPDSEKVKLMGFLQKALDVLQESRTAD